MLEQAGYSPASSLRYINFEIFDYPGLRINKGSGHRRVSDPGFSGLRCKWGTFRGRYAASTLSLTLVDLHTIH